MKIYELKMLKETPIGTKVFVKFKFKKDNSIYQDFANIISNNKCCCIVSGKEHKILSFYYDATKDDKALVEDKNEVLEIYKL